MKKTVKKETIATILDCSTVSPEIMKINNSKWAIITYVIDEKVFTSKNRIQVPMRYSEGDTAIIKYDVNDPTQIFTKHLFVI